MPPTETCHLFSARSNKNRNEQHSILGDGSPVASTEHSTLIEHGSTELGHEKSNGTGQFLVTPRSPKKNRSWSVTVFAAIGFLLAATLGAYLLRREAWRSTILIGSKSPL